MNRRFPDIILAAVAGLATSAFAADSADRREETPIEIDLERQTATIDLAKSGLNGGEYWTYFLYRDPNPPVSEQVAPIEIAPGEKIRLRVFLDKSTLEVFVNDRQCLSQLVYPTLPDATGVRVFAKDAPISLESVDAWELFPTNPY